MWVSPVGAVMGSHCEPSCVSPIVDVGTYFSQVDTQEWVCWVMGLTKV